MDSIGLTTCCGPPPGLPDFFFFLIYLLLKIFRGKIYSRACVGEGKAYGFGNHVKLRVKGTKPLCLRREDDLEGHDGFLHANLKIT